MIQATLIHKEDIPKLKIPNQEALHQEDDIRRRRDDLDRAMKLGNTEHNKVKIAFKTDEGIVMVETTVWEVTQNYVILKSNTHVPIRSIVSVECFE